MWEALKRVFVGGSVARKRTQAENEDWIIFLARAILFGLCLAMLIGYLSGPSRPDGFVRGSIAVLTSISAMFVGGIVGFLFGIPRAQSGNLPEATNQADRDDYRRRYLENTNLEQVSDWLTKIIIGISLVQFNTIVANVSDFAEKIGPAFLPDIGESLGPVAFVWLVFFGIVGFLFSYMWTRVVMVNVLTRSSATLAAELTRVMDTDANILTAVEEHLDGVDIDDSAAAARIRKLVGEAPFSARQQIFNHARDWRKRKWRAEDYDELARALPVFAGLNDAAPEEYHRNYGQYAYVLKDKTDPEWVEAATALTDAIMIRDNGGVTGYAIYETNLADCLIATDAGFLADKPTDAAKAARIHAYLAKARGSIDLTTYDRIQAWLALNPMA